MRAFAIVSLILIAAVAQAQTSTVASKAYADWKAAAAESNAVIKINAATNPIPSQTAAAINAATNPIPAARAAAITAATNPIPSWITAATNAILRVPTNAVTGWLLYDSGSNKWLRVTVSNYSYYISEVL